VQQTIKQKNNHNGQNIIIINTKLHISTAMTETDNLMTIKENIFYFSVSEEQQAQLLAREWNKKKKEQSMCNNCQ